MLDVMVISSDDAFADVLCDTCKDNKNVRPDPKKVTIEVLPGLNYRNGVVLLVVEDAREGLEQVAQILEIATDILVVGVMRDDEPELAFDLITHGAYYALAVPSLRNDSGELSALEMLRLLLYPLLAEIVSGQRNPRLRSAKLDGADNVFVSMSYDSAYRNSREEHDYHQAIVPSLKKLGIDVELSRDRRNRYGQTTNAKLLEEIHQSRIMLIQGSNMTEYVAYEFGAADSALRIRDRQAKGHEISLEDMVILCPASATLSSIASGLDRLVYLNRTDLALNLYLGLGGTVDDLRRCASQIGVKTK